MRIKVIGAGGIGSALLPPLARFLNFSNNGDRHTVTVIDGDTYEEKNRERQQFDQIGNKAEVTVESLKDVFHQVRFRAKDEYVTPDSVDYLISDGDIVLLCVDNHQTRKLVSDHCETLDNVVLISGGNEYTDGNIQIHIRKDGQNLTLPVANQFHPEIQNPADRRPDELGCADQQESAPQLIFMNFMIAALMLNAFYSYSQGKLKYDEAYADILTNNTRAVTRRETVLT